MLDHLSPPSVTAGSGDRPLLGGRYRLDAVLGRGGMATVHRAHDILLERDVAGKVFPAVAEGADELLRSRVETQVLATLSHPALVTLYDAGSVHHDDQTQQMYLVMELVEGPALADRLHEGALTVEQTVAVGRDVAEALAVAHGCDIVHRDLKPANILLTGAAALDVERRGMGPVVKLADFGIARLAGATRLTLTGMTLGTVSYLSPEQATGGEIGSASDVYGLGLVLLECATGRQAFTGTMAEVASARLVAPPEVPAELGPLGELLSRMTRLAPQDRPDAGQVAAELTRMLAGATDETLALPAVDGAVPPPPRRLGRLRSRRVGLAAGAMVLLASGALIVGQLTAGDDAPIAPPSYPAVEGSVGQSLTDLQQSVQP